MRAFAADAAGLGLSSARVRDIADPEAGPGRARVEVRAAALNAADLKVLEWRDGAGFIHAKSRPLIVGYDFAGVVDQLGAGVTGVAVGDSVFGFLPYARSTTSGTLAERVVVDAASVARTPTGVTHEQAAALGTAGVTALQGLRDKLRMKAGQSVVIHGASGGVGTFAVQIAKKLGLTVIATASATKLEAVRALGADQVFDYRSTSVAALPGPVDGFFDAAVKSSYGECKALLAPGAGYLTLLPSLSFVTGKLVSLWRSHHVEFLSVAVVPADLEQLAAWVADGSLKPVIGLSVPLDDAARAMAEFHAGKVLGKIVVTL